MNDSQACPYCKSDRVVRYGLGAGKKQRYRCQAEECRRQFTPGGRKLPDEIRRQIEDLLDLDVKPSEIHRAFGDRVTLRTIHRINAYVKPRRRQP